MLWQPISFYFFSLRSWGPSLTHMSAVRPRPSNPPGPGTSPHHSEEAPPIFKVEMLVALRDHLGPEHFGSLSPECRIQGLQCRMSSSVSPKPDRSPNLFNVPKANRGNIPILVLRSLNMFLPVKTNLYGIYQVRYRFPSARGHSGLC